MTGGVGPVARALGFAGLLPQAAAVGVVVIGTHGANELAIVGAYACASLILSFLGGIWWGLAMRRESSQASLVAFAILPSLTSLAILPTFMLSWWLPLILLGAAVLLTLLVDWHLVSIGEAPEGWMGLRVPLSVGLGGLTIAAGLLFREPITQF